MVNYQFDSPERTIGLFIGGDGMRATKSSRSESWPILGLLQIKNAKPFGIVVFHNREKPGDSNDFLRHFIMEILPVIENGFDYEGTWIRIDISAFAAMRQRLVSSRR